MNDIDKAIEYYHDHNGDEMSINFIYVSICLTLEKQSLKNSSLSNMINVADEIIKKFESEYINEMMCVTDIIYRCLYNHIMTFWYKNLTFLCIVPELHHLISIRQVTSYADIHKNRYKIREIEYNTLHHNYYVIENKINDRLKSRYGDKIRERIINRIMVMMYSLKLISKYHCKLQYDLIQSVVKDFGAKQLY